ncbi:hypothetical protein AAA081_06130 [Aedoeadaptatus acetigenes]|uniref:Uncharacterized protein n=1 Tax=Aedoeadaptatus acetigenes TaxID=2981723 RepID=A0ABV1J6P1_9FIRM
MVKKRTLFLLAGLIWSLAGGNVLKIGLQAYTNAFSVLNVGLTALVFFLFWTRVFHPLVGKHVIRIHGYEEEYKRPWNFFDKKSFLIMAFMMTFGIAIRVLNLMPDSFIAFFYTGLGTALAMAGILFLANYIGYDKKAVSEE